MKTIKTIKLKDVEVSVEEIQRLIKENPDILKEEKGGRYFFPENDEKYCFVYDDGEEIERTNGYYCDDISAINTGVFRTLSEARVDLEKTKAIVSCWKWAQENAPFEPDWGDVKQKKYYVYYSHSNKKLDWNCTNTQYQFTLPYFKSQEDCEAFIKANKDSLELLFTR